MKTLRTIVSALMLATASTSMADNYQYLTVTQTDGDTSFAVVDIRKITFDATNMVLHLADGATQTLPLTSLQKMFFASESAAIEAVAQGEQKVHFSNGMLRADLQAGEAVTLFNMKGEQEFSTNKSGTYDLKHLAKGVYIVKVGQESKKIINK